MDSAVSHRSWLSQALQNKIIALVLAMIVAVPLLAAPADYSLTGLAALTLEGSALVLMTVMLWRSRWDLRRENLQAFVRTGANVPILLLLGWVTVSCALSPVKVFSLQSLLQIGAGVLLYFAVGYQFRQSKHLSLLADVLLFLGGAAALGGMAQYQLYDLDRARALFGDPQPLGSFVMLLLPIVAALALKDKNPRRQIVAQIVSILMVGCLLLTFGRSAWMGGLVGLATLAMLSARVREQRAKTSLPLAARKHQFVMPALLSVIALGFVLVMNVQNGGVASRMSTVSSLATDISWQSRLQSHWHGAAEMIQARPLTGWGTGLFPVYQKQFTHMGAGIAPGGLGTRASLAEQAHNLYLQTAVELGLPGLVLLLSVLAFFWVSAWKRVAAMDDGIRRTLLIGSMAATAGFAVDAVSSPSWQYAQTSMFFWLVLGIGTSCLRPRVRHEEEVVAPATQRRMTLIARPAAVAACLCGATLLPTVRSSAQSTGYNTDDNGGNNANEIAFGAAAAAALVYALSGGFGGGGAAGGAGTGGGDIIVVPTPTPTPTPTPVSGAAAPMAEDGTAIAPAADVPTTNS